MRLDGDGRALNEASLYLTVDEAREVIRVLQRLVEVAPTLDYLTHNHVDDGQRQITLYVYTSHDIERQHDEGFAAGGEWRRA
jgi:hypothetical protein